MTSRIQSALEARKTELLPDNTEGGISAEDIRDYFTDLVDSCFRENAIAIEAGNGRLVLESGLGYIALDAP
jgi:hypothetical protein